MKPSDGTDDDSSTGLTRRRVLSLGVSATGLALGVGALSGSAAAWKRFDVDFDGCSTAHIVVARADLHHHPPAVAHVVVALDGETTCRTVEATSQAATTMPDRFGESPVLTYRAESGATVLGVIEYSYAPDRFSKPVCVLPNPACPGEDGPDLHEADCVLAGKHGYWNGGVRECWFEPLDHATTGGGDRQPAYSPQDADDVEPHQRAHLSGPDGRASFGAAVEFDESGDVLLVGAPGDDGPGAAHVYRPADGGWHHSVTLTPDERTTGDDFGQAVALDEFGQTAVVGAPGAETVYEFAVDDGVATQVRSIAAPVGADGTAPNGFGTAVSLDAKAETVLVGAGPGRHDRMAYAFDRSRDGWRLDGTVGNVTSGTGPAQDLDLAASGASAAIGAPSSGRATGASSDWACLAERSTTGWATNAWLVSAVASDDGTLALSCDANGQTVVVGRTPGDDGGSGATGSAVVFAQVGDAWQDVATLAASGGTGPAFGRSVAVDGDGSVALVGAPGDDPAAYFFATDGSGWQEIERLAPEDVTAGFGGSVAVDAFGNHAAVGEPAQPRSDDGGRVTVYAVR